MADPTPRPLSGGCLCGAVRYRAEQGPQVAADCYCTDCRRASGTTHCTHVMSPETGFTCSGSVTGFDKPADSGNVVRRLFCPICGSGIYSTNSGMPGAVFLRASSLDDPAAVEPQMTVYASRAPAWARIDPDKPAFAEMPDAVPPV